MSLLFPFVLYRLFYFCKHHQLLPEETLATHDGNNQGHEASTASVDRYFVSLYESENDYEDIYQYEEHFSLFLCHSKSVSGPRKSYDIIQNPFVLTLHKGINYFVFADPVSGHGAIGRDFELPIIDSVLQFMARQAQGSTSDISKNFGDL
jgi:hypothetical protein